MLVHPQPNPIAFSIGPVDIHWYGLMYVVAFAQFLMLGRLRIRQPHIAAQGWTKDDLDDMLFYQPLYFLQHPLEIFMVWRGGMSFHGGFLGVLIAMKS